LKLTELIKDMEEALGELGDVDVVMSKDGEGNQFSPLAAYGVGKYAADNTWSGEFYSKREEGDEEEYFESPEDAVSAVVLWPTN
jgi:hypothetical protein